jgi:hypothetical protein
MDVTLFQRLPPYLQNMAAALGELIQRGDGFMGQRYLIRHWHVAATDQPRI